MSEDDTKIVKKVQHMALLCNTLISFGDAIEMFLPAVITQPISCELGVSTKQEHIAALSLYLSFGVMSILAIPLSNKIGRRTLLLVAMYFGITITILCSIVSNYVFLILSRLLLGCTLSLNLATSGVYMAELSISKQFYTFSMTVMATAYSLGGGWCGLLAYFLIERIGWRYFILFTSLPIFIPPLILLQFYLPETLNNGVESSENVKISKIAPKLKSVITRIMKLSLFTNASNLIFSGDILLVPVIMRDINNSNMVNVPCGAIHGTQFLAVTGLFGGCHIVGRFISYVLQNKLPTGKLFVISSLILLPLTTTCYAFSYNTTVVFTGLMFIQIIASMIGNEVYILMNDTSFFTDKYTAIAAGFLICGIQLNTFVTCLVSEILEYKKTLCVHVVCAVFSFLISLTFLFDD